MTTSNHRCYMTVILAIFSWQSLTASVTTAKATAQQAAEDSDPDASVLTEALRSPKFSKRRAAARQLRALGPAGHRILEKAALSDDPESATRAIDLLHADINDRDQKTSQSATESLKRISQAKGPRGESARQALKKTPESRRSHFLPQIRIQQAPGNAPHRQPPVFGQRQRHNLRVTIRSVNGVAEIEVIENNKRYRFKETNAGIETGRPDGKGGTRRKTYKNTGEMQRRDAESYRAYQKAGRGFAPPRILRNGNAAPAPVPRISPATIPPVESQPALPAILET